jgi:hypothetical protein
VPQFSSTENGAANDDDASMPPFLYLNTREELVTVLECKDAALDFVSLCTPEKPCKTAGCDYPAADHNYNKCWVHERSWIPTKHTSMDGCIRHGRGHMLLGPEFSVAQNPGAKACCCDIASCKGIGYTASLFAIPSDPTVLDKYLQNSGVMFADKKKKRFERIQEISSLLIGILMLSTDIMTRKMRNGIL